MTASRLLALLLLGGVLLALAAAVALPVHRLDSTLEARIDTLQDQLSRFGRFAAAREALEQARTQAEASRNRGGYYLEGNTPTLAAATLQRRVTQLVGRFGASVVSTQVLPSAEEGGFQRIGLRVHARGALDALRRVLYELETGEPYLFLGSLRVRVWTVSRGRGGPQEGDLDIFFDLHGYLPPGDASG